MTNSLSSMVFGPMIACLVTYILHSSLLLASAWVFTQAFRDLSHTLRERIWKFAALTGLVTAPLQVFTGIADSGIAMSLPMMQVDGDSNHRLAIGHPGLDLGNQDFATADSAARYAIPGDTGNWNGSQSAIEGHGHELDNSRLDGEPRYSNQQGLAEAQGFLEFGFDADELEPASAASLDVVEPSGQAVAQNTGREWRRWLSLAALLVAAFGLIRLFGQTIWLRGRLADSKSIDGGPIRSDLDKLLANYAIKSPVHLLSSQRFSEPVAYGLFRWRVVLPSGIDQRLSRDEIKALLAHELAHLVRGDAYWLWVGRLLCACFPMQPLNFTARRKWQCAAEFLCDEWAVDHHVPALTLAKCLTTVAEWQIDRPVPEAALAARGKQSDLGKRIERLVADEFIQDANIQKRFRVAVPVLGVMLAGLLVWRGPYAVSHARDGLTTSHGRLNLNAEQFSFPVQGENMAGVPDSTAALELIRELSLLDQELSGLTEDLSDMRRLLDTSSANGPLQELADRIEQAIASLSAKRIQLVDEIYKKRL